MEQRLKITDLFGEDGTIKTTSSKPKSFEETDFAVSEDSSSDSAQQSVDVIVPVTFTDTEEVIIPEIKDLYGRISDIVDGISEQLGLAVIPFDMANITPELVRLQRHDIFVLGDTKYAMIKEPRMAVVDKWVTKITKMLSSGLPFVESLLTTVTYNERIFHTLLLSKAEWSLIMSKFRRYKQRLYTHGGDLILEIYAERV